MAVAIGRGIPVDRIVAAGGPAAELAVIEADSGVDDVDVDVGGGGGVGVGGVERQVTLIHSVETPGRTLFSFHFHDRGDSVRLNPRHSAIPEKPLASGIGDLPGEAIERVGVHEVGTNPMLAGDGSGVGAVLESDDEAARD